MPVFPSPLSPILRSISFHLPSASLVPPTPHCSEACIIDDAIECNSGLSRGCVLPNVRDPFNHGPADTPFIISIPISCLFICFYHLRFLVFVCILFFLSFPNVQDPYYHGSADTLFTICIPHHISFSVFIIYVFFSSSISFSSSLFF